MEKRGSGDWKERVSDVLQTCQQEIVKTTTIGKKMLTASRTNSCLHEALEELGSLALKDLRDNKLEWTNSKVEEILSRIDQCEEDLSKIEDDVKELKKEKN